MLAEEEEATGCELVSVIASAVALYTQFAPLHNGRSSLPETFTKTSQVLIKVSGCTKCLAVSKCFTLGICIT